MMKRSYSYVCQRERRCKKPGCGAPIDPTRGPATKFCKEHAFKEYIPKPRQPKEVSDDRKARGIRAIEKDLREQLGAMLGGWEERFKRWREADVSTHVKTRLDK